MANLVDGKISKDPIAKVGKMGDFQRPASSFRGTIRPHEAQRDRYHLYVSYACPWAHRTLILRALKKLESVVGVSVTEPFMGPNGWSFHSKDDPQYLAVVYLNHDPKYTGKITVPVLWDKKSKKIVNNESSEIIRILNSSFENHTDSDIDLYPENLRKDIDEINEKIYRSINNGVYRTGFASTQPAYDKACKELFGALDEVEMILSRRNFLTGPLFTEADVRLFTTLIRFDHVYHGHFKCNLRMLKDYQNLHAYMRSIYQIPEIRATCHFDHIKTHYYQSHDWINPTRIVPLGPDLDFDRPHHRGEIIFSRRTNTTH